MFNHWLKTSPTRIEREFPQRVACCVTSLQLLRSHHLFQRLPRLSRHGLVGVYRSHVSSLSGRSYQVSAVSKASLKTPSNTPLDLYQAMADSRATYSAVGTLTLVCSHLHLSHPASWPSPSTLADMATFSHAYGIGRFCQRPPSLCCGDCASIARASFRAPL